MADTMPDTVVYVSNAASKEIYALAMNRESGELSMLDKVPVPGTDKPSSSLIRGSGRSTIVAGASSSHRTLTQAARTSAESNPLARS